MGKDKPLVDSVHKGHRERLREKFLRGEADDLAPHEVLEFMLFSVYKYKDTNVIAHRLIERFGCFSAVLDASFDELVKVEGVGKQAASCIKTYRPVAAYYEKDKLANIKKFGSYGEVRQYCASMLSSDNKEALVALFLNNGCGLLSTKKWKGSINRINVMVRDFVEECVRTQATMVAIAHSHPDGEKAPSEEDKRFTKILYSALMSMDVVLAEHIVVGSDGQYSFRKEGLLDQYADHYRSAYNPYDRPSQTPPVFDLDDD